MIRTCFKKRAVLLAALAVVAWMVPGSQVAMAAGNCADVCGPTANCSLLCWDPVLGRTRCGEIECNSCLPEFEVGRETIGSHVGTQVCVNGACATKLYETYTVTKQDVCGVTRTYCKSEKKETFYGSTSQDPAWICANWWPCWGQAGC